MSSDPELWSIQFSPWSLRVKWALNVLNFPFKTVEYALPLSEWQLRWKLWQWRVTVPVLFARDVTLKDGKDIVKYAQYRNSANAAKVWIDGVDQWVNTADEIMGMLRHRTLEKMLSDPAALELAVPKNLKWLGGAGAMIVRNAISGMAAKYPTPYNEQAADAIFDRIRAAIQSSDTDYILGDFSYADICVAMVLQMVRPVPDDVLKIPRGIRASFAQEDVATRCEDLLEWRDKVFAAKWVQMSHV